MLEDSIIQTVVNLTENSFFLLAFDLLDWLKNNPLIGIPLLVLIIYGYIADSLEKSKEPKKAKASPERLEERARINAEIKILEEKRQRRIARRKAAEAKEITERNAKRKENVERKKNAKREAGIIASHMPSRLSDLTPIVLEVVESYDFSECKKTIEVIDADDVDSVLRDYSERLTEDYKKGIRDYINSISPISFSYENKIAVEKFDHVVEEAVRIGSRAIGKSIGLSTTSTGSTSSKGEIRKTRKWVE